MAVNKIAQASFEHIPYLAENMRHSDIREVRLASGRCPEGSLNRAIGLSPDICYTWLRNDNPIAMFGVSTASLMSDKGCPWFLGTYEVYEDRMYWLRKSRKIVDYMATQYTRLENYVWAKNTESVKWLKWCGFVIDDPVEYGVERELFHKFWRINKNV